MLSIIICSKNPTISPELEKNILETTGVDYELIIIDNSRNEYSIFASYNEGIHKSKFPYLCFVHDDVLFKTENWGKLVCRHLSDETVGVIGIAGGDIATRIPGPWSISGQAKSFIQSDKSKKRKTVFDLAQKSQRSLKQEVVLLDGVWLCMRHNIFEKIMFDDKTFDGFHAYDYDICIQAKLKGYKNFVVYDIIIEHFSWGIRNKDWVINLLKVFTKWQPFLPVTLNNYSKEEIQKLETKNFYLFVKRMVHVRFTRDEILESVSELWKQVFPEKPVNDLRRQLIVMKILKFFKILGLKTHF
ncbi:MAG: glycosyltransferase [Bacteroidetes bacterium]|nr:glycosyltransferase [Bacteroidota bacterium]